MDESLLVDSTCMLRFCGSVHREGNCHRRLRTQWWHMLLEFPSRVPWTNCTKASEQAFTACSSAPLPTICIQRATRHFCCSVHLAATKPLNEIKCDHPHCRVAVTSSGCSPSLEATMFASAYIAAYCFQIKLRVPASMADCERKLAQPVNVQAMDTVQQPILLTDIDLCAPIHSFCWESISWRRHSRHRFTQRGIARRLFQARPQTLAKVCEHYSTEIQKHAGLPLMQALVWYAPAGVLEGLDVNSTLHHKWGRLSQRIKDPRGAPMNTALRVMGLPSHAINARHLLDRVGIILQDGAFGCAPLCAVTRHCCHGLP